MNRMISVSGRSLYREQQYPKNGKKLGCSTTV